MVGSLYSVSMLRQVKDLTLGKSANKDSDQYHRDNTIGDEKRSFIYGEQKTVRNLMKVLMDVYF